MSNVLAELKVKAAQLSEPERADLALALSNLRAAPPKTQQWSRRRGAWRSNVELVRLSAEK